jgi:hypothetical protein
VTRGGEVGPFGQRAALRHRPTRLLAEHGQRLGLRERAPGSGTSGPQRPPNRPRFEPPSAPPPPRDTGTRPTPEQIAEFEKDPLIGALMRDLGAQPLSIKTND